MAAILNEIKDRDGKGLKISSAISEDDSHDQDPSDHQSDSLRIPAEDNHGRS